MDIESLLRLLRENAVEFVVIGAWPDESQVLYFEYEISPLVFQ